MKSLKICGIGLILVTAFTASAFAQVSTTGPEPPEGIDMGLYPKTRAQVKMPGVPAYEWHHGCGPTALGMVVGYYDMNGYRFLVPGGSSGMITEVYAMIANDNADSTCGDPAYSDHYHDYACPIDYSPNIMEDKSETGGAHQSNCLADFMRTSWSSLGLPYGWSFYSDVGPAFTAYVSYVATQYTASYENRLFSSITWEEYKAEIDAGRPVVLLVDTNGDGGTDHFVTGIGYDDAEMRYGVFNTWDVDVHWYLWRNMASGNSWGIYGLTLFDISVQLKAINVPDDADNIQAAIDSAEEGDTIIVADGVYTGEGNRDISFNGHPVVKSVNGSEYTIIDCSDPSRTPHQGILISNGVGPESRLEGFTIRNGSTSPGTGGGLQIYYSSPIVTDIVLENNEAFDGGGLSIENYSSPHISNTTIRNNTAGYRGGGIYVYYSSPVFENCIITNNNAVEGGAMYLWSLSQSISNCTFAMNDATYGAGIYCNRATPSMENTILAFNTSGVGMYCSSASHVPTLACCDIFGNEDGDWISPYDDQATISGNFSSDPAFCDADDYDYTIFENSPCAPDNNDCSVLIGAGDIGCSFICGDADGDMLINILDIVFIINFIYKSGPEPNPVESVDVNSDYEINILDVVYIINYVYKSGPEPDCP